MTPVIGAGLLVVLAVSWIAMYNVLVRRRNRADQAWSTIDVQLVQRAELVPKLVESVKHYLTHERQLLEEIVRRRNEAVGSRSTEERMAAEAGLTAALGRLRVTVEAYPELKSSENFLQLQRALNEVEEQIAAARRSYNGAVTDYNNAVQTIPLSVVANAGRFHARSLYIADEGKREDVDMRELFA